MFAPVTHSAPGNKNGKKKRKKKAVGPANVMSAIEQKDYFHKQLAYVNDEYQKAQQHIDSQDAQIHQTADFRKNYNQRDPSLDEKIKNIDASRHIIDASIIDKK